MEGGSRLPEVDSSMVSVVVHGGRSRDHRRWAGGLRMALEDHDDRSRDHPAAVEESAHGSL